MIPLFSFLSSFKAIIELSAGQQSHVYGSLEPMVHPWGIYPLAAILTEASSPTRIQTRCVATARIIFLAWLTLLPSLLWIAGDRAGSSSPAQEAGKPSLAAAVIISPSSQDWFGMICCH